jgi:hypothetical protein
MGKRIYKTIITIRYITLTDILSSEKKGPFGFTGGISAFDSSGTCPK